MAHFVDELNAHPSILERIGDFMFSFGGNLQRAQEMERLCAMTDEQLAARGLRREDIARHVFRDVYSY